MSDQDFDRTEYSDEEIATIERAAEQRGFDRALNTQDQARLFKESGTSYTVEVPAHGSTEMAQALVNSVPGGNLANASHAGLALTVGDLAHRIERLEGVLQGLGFPINGVPVAVAVEPAPSRPIAEAVTDLEQECKCGHKRGVHFLHAGPCLHGTPEKCPCSGFEVAKLDGYTAISADGEQVEAEGGSVEDVIAADRRYLERED